MIIVDNAVELIIKTYLSLPQRINNLKISRTEHQEFSESFPKLLDALEKYSKPKVGSLDLGEIEWYHRLRNQLYHQGNGLIVERTKVEIYGQIALALFKNLFSVKLAISDDKHYLLAEFISSWANFEKAAYDLSSFYYFDENTEMRTTLSYANELNRNGYLTKSEYIEIKNLWKIRNQVIHSKMFDIEMLTTEMVERIKQITKLIHERIESS